MYLASDTGDYRLLDCGGGEKLEAWRDVTLVRPDPQAIWEKERPLLWDNAQAIYKRSVSGGGHWEFKKKLPERWVMRMGGLSFYVRPTGFKHTGLFPEQAENWAFMAKSIGNAGYKPRVLNLFAYTGGATIACARSGAAVTHVDAAKSMVAWARENAALSGLANAPIRYIADDCMKFVLRERRRGNDYDAIVMDPPSYGRGAGGQVWKMEKDLFGLVRECAALLSDRALFFIINSYTTGLSGLATRNMLELCVKEGRGGQLMAGELALPVCGSAVLLPCGSTARWSHA